MKDLQDKIQEYENNHEYTEEKSQEIHLQPGAGDVVIELQRIYNEDPEYFTDAFYEQYGPNGIAIEHGEVTVTIGQNNTFSVEIY